nr:solute carrier family 25 member 46 [Bactrocera oleae]
MRCELCGSNQRDVIQYGHFIGKQNIMVHTNCLFFSSGLQGLRDEYGVYSFLLNEISNQRRLFNGRNCCYCKKNLANISCSHSGCQRTFHFICGLQNGTRNQFVPPYRSYCHRHVRVPKYRPKANELCCICYENIFAKTTKFNPATMLRSPCCRKYWFHKLCLQTYAHSAGDLFRCPLCNNNDNFLTTMRYWGVFVPEAIGHVELLQNVYAIVEEELPRCLFEDGYINSYHGIRYDDLYLPKSESKGLMWFSWFIENVISHPFIVLRQQCQVNIVALRFHLLPFSLVPIIIQLYSRQGAATFWKGLGCSLILKGISWLVGKYTFTGETSLIACVIRQCIEAATLVLKRSCLMSTVGSILVPHLSSNSCKQQISLKSLFFPYMCMEIAKYEFRALVKVSTLAILRKNRLCATWELENQKMEIKSDLIARIITEVAFYPLETILHRLLLQGTDTIIDNLDNGKSMQKQLTYYQGIGDCYNTIVSMEGYTGLYKGFGALFMQFSMHTVILNVGMWIFS